MRWTALCAVAVAAMAVGGAAEARRRVATDFTNEAFPRTGWFSDSNEFLDVGPDGSQALPLGFSLNYGQPTPASLVFVNENGAITVGAPLADTAFTPIARFADAGVDIAAAAYVDLNAGFRRIRLDVGRADSQPGRDGLFDLGEAVPAVRISWLFFPLASDPDADGVSSQIIFYDRGGGDFDLEFTSDPEIPGSISGFSLGEWSRQVSSPYGPDSPGFFRFRSGDLVETAVPAPASTALLLGGFALAVAARRAARR